MVRGKREPRAPSAAGILAFRGKRRRKIVREIVELKLRTRLAMEFYVFMYIRCEIRNQIGMESVGLELIQAQTLCSTLEPK